MALCRTHGKTPARARFYVERVVPNALLERPDRVQPQEGHVPARSARRRQRFVQGSQ
jgi:hypothetical protein